MKTILSIALSLICTFAYADTIHKISQEQAWEIVKQDVLDNKCENINVYVSTYVISPNTQIKTLGRDENSPNIDSWLFFIDDIPYGNWSHPCRYIYVDSENGKVITHNHSMPLSGIDMKPLIEQEVDNEILLYDSKKMKEQLPKTIVTNSTLKNYASSKDYAVIINGGVKDSLNYIRYWNDCAAIYSTLVNVYGYNRNHIYVLMSDGTNPANDRRTNYGFDSSPLDLDGDGTNDIQYAATRTNVISVFNQLGNALTTDNNLFIYTMDHGGIFGNNSYLCLWNNEKLYDYEFASLLSNIDANSINICMGQCHSGGFIDNLSNSKYVIATACKYNEISYSLYSGYDGYDAFVYYWTAAVTGAYPNGTTANADTNNDGYISMREAFNYAMSNDPANETPQFDYTPLGIDSRLNLFMEKPDIISGDNLIYSNKSYIIPNLPAGTTVSWSLSDSYYNQNCLQQNYPSLNQCTITRSSSHDMMNATLTAEIKYNGVTIQTLTKTGIYAYNDFYGQYTSDNLSGTINYTHIFYVKPGFTTVVTSPNFYGATVTYDSNGTTPSYFYLEPTTWKLYFTMSTNNNGTPVIINVNDGCENYYQLYAMPQAYLYLEITNGENEICITLHEEGEDSSKSLALDQPWSVEICNAASGVVMATRSSTDRSVSIPTSAWPKGVYAVKATVGKTELTEKVVVK